MQRRNDLDRRELRRRKKWTVTARIVEKSGFGFDMRAASA